MTDPHLAKKQENPHDRTATTASNGHTKPRPTPERTHGMARVQEVQGWYLASVARDAAGEAERLCSDIERAASAVYTRQTGLPKPTFTDDPP